MNTYGIEKLGIVNTTAVYRNLKPSQLTEGKKHIYILANIYMHIYIYSRI